MEISAHGIAWYRTAEDYRDLRAIFTDPDTLPDTYEDWLAQAEQVEKRMKAEGGRVVRAYIDPVDFPKWWQDHGCDVNAHGRMEFANAEAVKGLL